MTLNMAVDEQGSNIMTCKDNANPEVIVNAAHGTNCLSTGDSAMLVRCR